MGLLEGIISLTGKVVDLTNSNILPNSNIHIHVLPQITNVNMGTSSSNGAIFISSESQKNARQTHGFMIPVRSAATGKDLLDKQYDMPFTLGSHYVINQPAWWEGRNHMVIGDNKLVPAQMNEEIIVSVINSSKQRNQSFKVKAIEDNRLLIAVWADNALQEIQDTDSFKVYQREWIVTGYSADSYIEVDEFSNIVLSFDPKLVKYVWIITQKHERYSLEKYIIVVKN